MTRLTVSFILLTCTTLFFWEESYATKRNQNWIVPLTTTYYLSADILKNQIQGETGLLQDEKTLKKQDRKKKDNLEVDIKQVPKAKRQVKPVALKPNIKVKPIKIMRPKIKKP